jgi:hypothetical protein
MGHNEPLYLVLAFRAGELFQLVGLIFWVSALPAVYRAIRDIKSASQNVSWIWLGIALLTPVGFWLTAFFLHLKGNPNDTKADDRS